MAEKKGLTGKLHFDFNESRCLEVEYNPNKWARVTAETFRSYYSNRRILNVDDIKNVFYEEYQGPVYCYMSNIICDSPIPGTNYVDGESAEDYISKRFKSKLKSI
jgi:hypothetical protein